MSSIFKPFKTDIARRGMGETFRGLGKSCGSMPRSALRAEVDNKLRELASQPGVTAVTATQTSLYRGRGGQWYFRVFWGISYKELEQRLGEKENACFEKQRYTVLLRAL